ncbi:MAG: glutathionylspermidine synthase family protein [Limisphaerales bacterium]
MSARLPYWTGEKLTPERFRKVRLRTIFECCKWDPQVEDTSTLAPYPILLTRSSWNEIAALAEKLAAETISGEEEISLRPELLKELALPRPIWKLLASEAPSSGGPRVMRFDFHYTKEGWRISEVNSDVPGGFVEADGFTQLMAEACGLRPTALPVKNLAASLLGYSAQAEPTIAFVHASAYSDDRQVMTFIAREVEKRGGTAVLLDPSQLRWSVGPGSRARIQCDWFNGAADAIFRFFPAEWLPNLKRTCDWSNYFTTSATPQMNPGSALISQSKRFGLMLDQLKTELPTWKQLLPQTCDVRDVRGTPEEWIIKPALGRVGEAIGMKGVTSAKEWKQIRRSSFFYPKDWVAQRRFEMLPVETPDGARYVCFGVYTIDGTAAGIYGRCSSNPIINHTAQDVAVLLKGE